MMGLPGAGKTTYARRISRRFGFLHIDRDEIRARKFAGIEDGRAKATATAEAFRLARGALVARRSVVLDGMTFATHAARRRARMLARRCGAECVEVFIDTKPETAKARIKSGPSHPARDRTPALVDVVAARFARVRPR